MDIVSCIAIISQVIWIRFYCSSSLDGGSLQQLRNLVNRRNVSSDPDKKFNATEDFFHLVGKAHIIVGCQEYFQIDSSTGTPQRHLSTEALLLAKKERREVLHDALCGFIDEVFCLDLDQPEHTRNDQVNMYATELLSYYFLYIELEDAIA